jgi:hypothetical protein
MWHVLARCRGLRGVPGKDGPLASHFARPSFLTVGLEGGFEPVQSRSDVLVPVRSDPGPQQVGSGTGGTARPSPIRRSTSSTTSAEQASPPTGSHLGPGAPPARHGMRDSAASSYVCPVYVQPEPVLSPPSPPRHWAVVPVRRRRQSRLPHLVHSAHLSRSGIWTSRQPCRPSRQRQSFAMTHSSPGPMMPLMSGGVQTGGC